MGEIQDDGQFDLLSYARTSAKRVLARLTEPDDDLMPILLAYSGRWGLSITGVEIGNAQEKADLARWMTARVAVQQAEQAAFICTAYLPLSDDEPGKQSEVIAIASATREGSQVTQAVSITRLLRSPTRPPEIGSDWEVTVGDEAAHMGGQFGNALQSGLRFAACVSPELQEILDQGHKEGRISGMVAEFIRAWVRVAAEAETN